MFDIQQDDSGDVRLIGRLDAISAPLARTVFDAVNQTCRVSFADLEYIASAGLGILAATQRRLMDQGAGLILADLSPHLREVLALAGFEGVFEFE